MQRIKCKLSNQKGVSVLFALIMFVVACMVSMVVVTAALSAAKQVISTHEEIQTNQDLESAALLLSKALQDKQYVHTKDLIEYLDGRQELKGEETIYDEHNPFHVELLAIGEKLLDDSRLHTPVTGDFKIRTTLDGAQIDEMPEVEIHYNVDQDADSGRDDQYTMNVTLTAGKSRMHLIFLLNYVKDDGGRAPVDDYLINANGTRGERIKKIHEEERITWTYKKSEGITRIEE